MRIAQLITLISLVSLFEFFMVINGIGIWDDDYHYLALSALISNSNTGSTKLGFHSRSTRRSSWISMYPSKKDCIISISMSVRQWFWIIYVSNDKLKAGSIGHSPTQDASTHSGMEKDWWRELARYNGTDESTAYSRPISLFLLIMVDLVCKIPMALHRSYYQWSNSFMESYDV